MILEARGLAIGHRGRRVGEDIDLGLAAGRTLALLGPNGGGKTTLLRTLLGLLAPIAGEVRLDGRPLAAIPVGERARLMAYVPQSHAGTFAFTVEDVVLMGRTAHATAFAPPSDRDRAVARDALDRLGLSALAQRPYTMISGGERQLALVARALAQEPRVVVLDEPTASLDFGNQGRVLGRMRELASAGLAVLFTTHDPNQALRYADDVSMLRDGRVLHHGASGEALARATLEKLYGSAVLEIGTLESRAFLPG